MNEKRILLIALVIFLLAGVFEMGEVIAISQSDFQNIVFSENRGNTDDESPPGGHVTYNIGKGWNLVPLKFLAEASGRFWGNFKEGKTCEQNIFQNVWYYSPIRGGYYHIPVMDDWIAPKTRNNEVLLKEFKAKYYHIYSGSAWVYSSENCILEGDDGTSLVSGNYGDAEQEKGYRHTELVLKAGWNFVPVDIRMVAYEKSLKDLFDSCSPQKFYKYDKAKNKWMDITSQINLGNKLVPGNIFETYLVKITNDCNFADYEVTSSSNPPAVPN